MAKNKKVVKKVSKPVTVGGSKAKASKVELVEYSIKAVIPVGPYANIQPEITVRAETVEQAERFAMPHIEAMFTKYRESAPGATVAPSETVTKGPQPDPSVKPQPTAKAPVKEEAKAEVVPKAEPIIMTVPFNRAKGAVEACASKEALKILEGKITNSDKLTQQEKNTLIMMVADKYKVFNGN